MFYVFKKRKKKPDLRNFTGFQRDPFEAVPIKNESAECRLDSRSCGQIRMPLESSKGLKRRLGFKRDMRIDLDPRGTFYWSQIDGSQDLRSIEKKLRKEFSLEADESRTATILFTKMLMLRHLIHLNIGEELPVTQASTSEEVRHG